MLSGLMDLSFDGFRVCGIGALAFVALLGLHACWFEALG